MTNTSWGRADHAGRWLHPKPVWAAAALALGVAAGGGWLTWDYTMRWTPLQRAYLAAYVRSGVMSAAGLSGSGRYNLLQVVTARGLRFPLDDEVSDKAAPDGELPPAGTDTGRLALTETARQLGAQALARHTAAYSHTALHAFLKRWIYHDRRVGGLVMPALWTGLVTAVLALFVAVPRDLARARDRRQGRRLRGPELVSSRQFNRRVHADGITFPQRQRRFHRPATVQIPHAAESSHFLIMGDSGTGKSALIRQILQELQARGETAIVYDPALDYTGQFYTPERGDRILNPLDARCPYWNLADEWQHEAETLTLATSLFPDRPHENTFFIEAPRRIFAHLLTRAKSPDELASWLCHDAKIDGLLAGTPYATMVDRQAPAQRAGVLASLNMVADTLKLLPLERQTTERWSATTWSAERKGWLFLTSTPETRPRLVPLTSLWLDTLVLRLMNQGRRPRTPTWFVLDELASLQRLPQLHTAITENRKSNNPVVLGFQGRSQLETRYGHDAETILSQPATKIFLRTTEPHAAKWISDTLGEIEIERLRESRSSGRGMQQSYGLERQVEPLVMPSEITGLAALRGFLKLGNLVVRMDVPFLNLVTVNEPFVERPGWGRRPPSAAGDADAPQPIVPNREPLGERQDPARERGAVHEVGQEP